MMTIMLLAEPPDWADQLSAWSTFATAVLALVAGAGAVGTFIVAWKAYVRQRDAFDEQSKLFREQIKQLEDDRRRREVQDQEQEERRLQEQQSQARKVSVKIGALHPYGKEATTLIGLVNVVEDAFTTSVYPAAYTLVSNDSASPIRDIYGSRRSL
ncbi:hypothetical protein ACQEVF_17760 [Nonomuraea polychroma]|uniref:hypothetical protein n=1 Tax=Nonomuraea polychroma TaxID=46176 RepID=UPI003D9078C9